MATRALPVATSFPIPRDVTPGEGWCAMMREMADHIGAYATLLIVERFGGRDVYVPVDAARSPFRAIVGGAAARTLSRVYGRETLAIPTGGYALRRVRRAGVIAAVRARDISVAEAARILDLRRDYVSRLVNRSDEGEGVASAFARPVDRRQLDLFASGAGGGD